MNGMGDISRTTIFLVVLSLLLGCKKDNSVNSVALEKAVPVCPQFITVGGVKPENPPLVFSVVGYIDEGGLFEEKRIQSHLVRESVNLNQARSAWALLFENEPDKMGSCVVSSADIGGLLNVYPGMPAVQLNKSDRIGSMPIESLTFYSDCEGYTLKIAPGENQGIYLSVLGKEKESVSLINKKNAPSVKTAGIQKIVDTYFQNNPQKKKDVLDLNGLEKTIADIKELNLSDFEVEAYEFESDDYEYLITGNAKKHYCNPGFTGLLSKKGELWISPQLIYTQAFKVDSKPYIYGYTPRGRCENAFTGVVFSIESYPPKVVHAQQIPSCN